MKTAFFLLTILFWSQLTQAQTYSARVPLSSPYYYDTCQYLQQLEGTWRYINANDTIRIYLRFHKDSSENSKYISTTLYGWHEYKSGNTIIESDYQNRFHPLSYFTDTSNLNYRSIFLQLWTCSPSQDTLSGTITDYNQVGEYHTVKAVLNPSRTAMTWKQTHREGYGFLTGATGMTLPREFILIKQ